MSEERDVLTGDVPQVSPQDEPVRGETLRDVVTAFIQAVEDSRPLRHRELVLGLLCEEWADWMRGAMERDDKEGSR